MSIDQRASTHPGAPIEGTGSAARPPRTLVIACGALARELLTITRQHGLDGVVVECLPAALHNRPEEIPGAVRARIRRARGARTSPGATAGDRRPGALAPDAAPADAGGDPVDGSTWSAAGDSFDRIFVGYADCGTGGLLDAVCEAEGVERLPGAHCYEFFASAAGFARLQDHELGTFYLTDFLVRHFDRLVWDGLGLDRHPDLRSMYFGNYTRLVYLAQTDDPALVAAAERAAERLGLDLTVEHTGYGDLETTVVDLASRAAPGGPHVSRPRRVVPGTTRRADRGAT